MASKNVIGDMASDCLMGRARLLTRVLTGMYDDELRPFGLKATQLNLLVVVAQLGPVRRIEIGRMIHLDQGPPVNYCRPAADPLFETAAAAFGARVLCVVLTGMGHDGRAGAGKIVEAGGRVIVQDESSSVVWGMPGAVAQAGYAEAVKPLKELSQLALRMMMGEAA